MKRADGNDSMMTTAFNLLKNAAEKLDKEASSEIDAFFLYAATKVKKYSPEMQQSVQQAVFEILMKADKGVLGWVSPNDKYSNNWQNPRENVSSFPTHPQQYVYQTLHPVSTPMQSPTDSLISVSTQPSPAASLVSEHFSDFV